MYISLKQSRPKNGGKTIDTSNINRPFPRRGRNREAVHPWNHSTGLLWKEMKKKDKHCTALNRINPLFFSPFLFQGRQVKTDRQMQCESIDGCTLLDVHSLCWIVGTATSRNFFWSGGFSGLWSCCLASSPVPFLVMHHIQTEWHIYSPCTHSHTSSLGTTASILHHHLTWLRGDKVAAAGKKALSLFFLGGKEEERWIYGSY